MQFQTKENEITIISLIQRLYEDKKAIIGYYNTIKDKYASKSEPAKKIDLKYVTVLD